MRLAIHSSGAGGASNYGFLTIEQCGATVSGIGAACEPPNQFHNPQPAARPKKNSTPGRRQLTGF